MLEGNKFLVRKKIFNWLGEEFEVFDSNNRVVLFGKQKAFRLKEELRIFTDSSKEEEVMTIKARGIIDFSAVYDVVDSKTGKKLGAIQRKGFQSLLKDEWHILDNNDEKVGAILEDNMTMALLRRFLTNLIPQNFSIVIGETEICEIRQHFNPFVYKLDIIFKDNSIDKRLILAGAILLSLIDGRQDSSYI